MNAGSRVSRITAGSLTVIAEEKESGDEVECYGPFELGASNIDWLREIYEAAKLELKHPVMSNLKKSRICIYRQKTQSPVSSSICGTPGVRKNAKPYMATCIRIFGKNGAWRRTKGTFGAAERFYMELSGRQPQASGGAGRLDI